MSAVPSKRFDRILPVIPPLCLLLVAMLRHVERSEWRGYSIKRLANYAAVAAFAISVSYASHDVVTNYMTRQGALVQFGKQVRAATSGQPLSVVSGKDEGMLLYTDQTRFTRTSDALDGWRSGQINWIVLPEKVLAEKETQFAPYQRLLQTGRIPDKSGSYILIGRTK